MASTQTGSPLTASSRATSTRMPPVRPGQQVRLTLRTRSTPGRLRHTRVRSPRAAAPGAG